MEKQYLIETSFGNFMYTRNADRTDGIKIYTTAGQVLYAINNVFWWDKDNVLSAFEKNKDKILEEQNKRSS